MFHTYVIYSASTDRYYTGHTTVGVDKRLQRHNNGWTRSTKAGIPWKLRYYKSFEEKSAAIKWERFIKEQKSRAFLQRLIDSDENEAVE